MQEKFYDVAGQKHKNLLDKFKQIAYNRNIKVVRNLICRTISGRNGTVNRYNGPSPEKRPVIPHNVGGKEYGTDYHYQ